MEPITWTNEKRKLGELTPWTRNPRQINKDEAKRLEQSLLEFGQIQTIAIGPDNSIYDGHQRDLVWSASSKFGKDFEVDVRVSSRPLTEKEREKLVIFLHKGASGEWNFDMLANEFEFEDLLEWGFSEAELGMKPEAGEWGDAMDKLPSEDRAPFQQMTFTLHDVQVEIVKDALKVSQSLGAFIDSENENSNGNALTRICEMFMETNGRS